MNLDSIIGQQQAKLNAQMLIGATTNRGKVLPHICYSGPAGTGKTTLGQAIADEVGVKIYHANGASIRNVSDIVSYLSKLKQDDILFIDEIHSMSLKASEILYTAMENFRYDYVKGDKTYSVSLAPFTLIGATTAIGKLSKPMRDRFKHIEELHEYSIDELSELTKRVAKDYKFTLSDKVATTIAKTCKGIPRIIISNTEWVYNYMIHNKLTSLSEQELLEIIAQKGIDENGLDLLDKKYLSVLESGAHSLTVLASKLNTDKATIENQIEPYLLKIGKITITKRGRELL